VSIRRVYRGTGHEWGVCVRNAPCPPTSPTAGLCRAAESGVPGRVTLTVVFGYGGYGVTS